MDFQFFLHFDGQDFVAIGVAALMIYWAKNHRQKLKTYKNGPQGKEKEERFD